LIPNTIRIMLVGFSDNIHHYRVISNPEKQNRSDRSLSSADE